MPLEIGRPSRSRDRASGRVLQRNKMEAVVSIPQICWCKKNGYFGISLTPQPRITRTTSSKVRAFTNALTPAVTPRPSVASILMGVRPSRVATERLPKQISWPPQSFRNQFPGGSPDSEQDLDDRTRELKAKLPSRHHTRVAG